MYSIIETESRNTLSYKILEISVLSANRTAISHTA